ncbi:MAG: hypothetical protein KQH63_16910 [Desulfobulbaceae bacterium]|nr:hypothetical protein [Desulfobulbaceae bacterium]
MDPDYKKNQLSTFALLSIAAARKKIYSQKAIRQGRPEVAHLLRALSESETIQARRIFHSIRGQIDTSAEYLATIFEKEIQAVIDEYTQRLNEVKEAHDPLVHAFTQLRKTEKILQSFYVRDKKDVSAQPDSRYFVCPFCGFVKENEAPVSCPVCGAARKEFREIP